MYKRMEDEEEKEGELRDYIETGKIIKSGALSAELKLRSDELRKPIH